MLPAGHSAPGSACPGDGPALSLAAEVAARLRVLVMAGVPVGVVVAGAGGRLAMLALRVSSPDGVNGVTSDDGFTIGRFTLGGTYNLLVIGAVVGFIGAAAYRAVAPWLLGPAWFRRSTVAVASGSVVGSMLIHSDGVDFVVLEPTWFAVGLFIVLPALFGLAMSIVVDHVVAAQDGTRRGWRSWVVPLALVAAFPLVFPFVAVATLVLAVWVPAVRSLAEFDRAPGIGVVARVGWLGIAVWGLVALVGDVQALL